MLKCVLLDANIIIESHKVGVWEKLIDRVEIVVSSIVAYKESHFYSKEEGGIPEPINLQAPKRWRTFQIILTEFFYLDSMMVKLNPCL